MARKRKGAFSKPKEKSQESPSVTKGMTMRTFKMNVTKALNRESPAERRAAAYDILARTVRAEAPEFAGEVDRLDEIFLGKKK